MGTSNFRSRKVAANAPTPVRKEMENGVAVYYIPLDGFVDEPATLIHDFEDSCTFQVHDNKEHLDIYLHCEKVLWPNVPFITEHVPFWIDRNKLIMNISPMQTRQWMLKITHRDVITGELDAEDGQTISYYATKNEAMFAGIEHAIGFVEQYKYFEKDDDDIFSEEMKTATLGVDLLTELLRQARATDWQPTLDSAYQTAQGLYLWRCQVMTVEENKPVYIRKDEDEN